MAYTKIGYQNSPSTATPLNAENLNHMDEQIYENDQRLTALEGAHVSSFNGRIGAVTPSKGDYDIGQIAPLTGAQVGQVPVVVNVGTEEDPELEFQMGAGGGGGHVIQNASGTDMAQESAMQFPDSFVSDDSVNGRTVVENIKEVLPADYDSTTDEGIIVCDDGEDAVIGPVSDDKVEVVGDGNKTMTVLLTSLFGDADLTKINRDSKITISNASGITSEYILTKNTTSVILFENTNVDSNSPYVNILVIAYASNTGHWTSYSSGGYTTLDSVQVADGDVITLYYGTSSTVINLKTSANYCQYDEDSTVADYITKELGRITNGQTKTITIPYQSAGLLTVSGGGTGVMGMIQTFGFSNGTAYKAISTPSSAVITQTSTGFTIKNNDSNAMWIFYQKIRGGMVTLT